MKEEEIRPKKIFDEYLRLASEDTEFYFRHADRVNGVCPACLGVGKPAFIQGTILKLHPQNSGLILFIKKRQRRVGKNFGSLKQN